jgi:hypothetical protein
MLVVVTVSLSTEVVDRGSVGEELELTEFRKPVELGRTPKNRRSRTMSFTLLSDSLITRLTKQEAAAT